MKNKINLLKFSLVCVLGSLSAFTAAYAESSSQSRIKGQELDEYIQLKNSIVVSRVCADGTEKTLNVPQGFYTKVVNADTGKWYILIDFEDDTRDLTQKCEYRTSKKFYFSEDQTKESVAKAEAAEAELNKLVQTLKSEEKAGAAPVPVEVSKDIIAKLSNAFAVCHTRPQQDNTDAPCPSKAMTKQFLKRASREVEYKAKLLRNHYMFLVDMNLELRERRGYLIDLDKTRNEGVVSYEAYRVAHGEKSGGMLATSFSNKPDSHKTSLGLYEVGTTHAGRNHPYALYLFGRDSGLNDNAVKRSIVLHEATYVPGNSCTTAKCLKESMSINEYHGRSEGCPAVADEHFMDIREKLIDGSFLFIYHQQLDAHYAK